MLHLFTSLSGSSGALPKKIITHLPEKEQSHRQGGGGGHKHDELLEWSEPSGDEDDQLSRDDFEFDRVEDEDWEIAERGGLLLA